MERGGNAVDAAIAALFCDGVSMPHSMGLGGGFLLTVYNKSTGEVWSLNSREVAPGAATVDMFKDNPKLTQSGIVTIIVTFSLKDLFQKRVFSFKCLATVIFLRFLVLNHWFPR